MLAKKIIKKYEVGTEDKREIFRDVGLGESQVAKNVKELCEQDRSMPVKLGANKLAAECLRLTQEPAQTHQGVQIVINCGPAAPGALPPGQVAPAQVIINGQEEASVLPTRPPSKPLQITK